MVDTTASRNLSREVESAIRLLREQGYDVTPSLRGPLTPPPVTGPEVRRVQPVKRPGESPWPAEHPMASPVRTLPSGLDEGEMVWHQTPESSNVYAFAYDKTEHILYVQYKANGEPNGKRRGTNSCTGEEYTYGVRPHAPGTIYSYGSRAKPVPEAIYSAMKSSASKGKFVWQNLRVCGSHWRHQYPYQVASVPMPRDRSQPYVPRKAIGPQHVTITDDDNNEYDTTMTDRFRVRTVPVVGVGRRQAYPSTIRRTT